MIVRRCRAVQLHFVGKCVAPFLAECRSIWETAHIVFLRRCFIGNCGIEPAITDSAYYPAESGTAKCPAGAELSDFLHHLMEVF